MFICSPSKAVILYLSSPQEWRSDARPVWGLDSKCGVGAWTSSRVGLGLRVSPWVESGIEARPCLPNLAAAQLYMPIQPWILDLAVERLHTSEIWHTGLCYLDCKVPTGSRNLLVGEQHKHQLPQLWEQLTLLLIPHCQIFGPGENPMAQMTQS